MLARKRTVDNDPSLSPEVREAKKLLAEKGWSYRTAAEPLQVGWPHLAKVLTGRRQSKRLIDRIHQLPHRVK